MNNPIIIAGSMDCEYKYLVESMQVNNIYKYGNYSFFEGMLNGKEVVVVNTLCGMVNAASAITTAILKYKPSLIITQGTAGAHNKELNQYDIILGKNLVEISTCFYNHADLGEGIHLKNASFIGEQIEEDGKIVWRNTLSGNDNLLNLAHQTPYTKGRVISGTIATGDVWNRELDKIAFIHEKFGTDCEEMESFAIAQIARQHDIPCLAVRIISNTEWNASIPFNENTGIECQRFVSEITKLIFK